MGRVISQVADDRNERGRKAIDRIADGVKELYAIWLEVQSDQAGDQAETSARIERETRPGPAISDKRELSVKELAARWGVSPRSIYEWKTTKGLPYIPHGRCLRFDWSEVDAWSKRHRESFTRARLRVVK